MRKERGSTLEERVLAALWMLLWELIPTVRSRLQPTRVTLLMSTPDLLIFTTPLLQALGEECQRSEVWVP